MPSEVTFTDLLVLVVASFRLKHLVGYIAYLLCCYPA